MDEILRYFVVRAYRYAESKSWEYNMVGMYNTLSTAKQAFHDNMGRIIKASNDVAMVILFDSYGNKIASDFDTTFVPEPAPEPNAE